MNGPATARTPAAAVAPILPMLWMQLLMSIVRYLRVPAFSVTSLALPVMFFAFFGLPNAGRRWPDGSSVGAYVVASLGAYAVSSVMVFSFGIGVAVARGQKIDVLQRATPLPPFVAVVATVVNAVLFAFASLVILFLFARVTAGVQMPLARWVELTGVLLVGALPLIGLGMSIGYLAGPSAAPAVANLIYLPMAFASGLFEPVELLPDFFQRIAPFLPTYHYGEVAHIVVGRGREGMGTAFLWLAVWTVVLFALAVRAYRQDSRRKFS